MFNCSLYLVHASSSRLQIHETKSIDVHNIHLLQTISRFQVTQKPSTKPPFHLLHYYLVSLVKMGNDNNGHNMNQRRTPNNDSIFVKLRDLDIGENDAERREACRRNPGNLVGAMEYLLKLKRQREESIKFIKSRYPNLSNDKIKDLLERNDYDTQKTIKFIQNDDAKDDEEDDVADLFLGLLALSVMNNAKNSMEHKISIIKGKYPSLSEGTIKDLLDRHDGDLENTLKFIEIKEKQEQERERRVAVK